MTCNVKLSSTSLIFFSSSDATALVDNHDFDSCMRETVVVISLDARTLMTSILENAGDVVSKAAVESKENTSSTTDMDFRHMLDCFNPSVAWQDGLRSQSV